MQLTHNLLLKLVFGRRSLNDLFQGSPAVACCKGTIGTIIGLLKNGNARFFRNAGNQFFGNSAEDGCGIRLCAVRFVWNGFRYLLDLPVPLRPTRAYRSPALSRSVASVRISRPVLRLAALAFAFVVPAGRLAVTVMLRPSISSYAVRASRRHLLECRQGTHLAIVWALDLEARLLTRHLDRRSGI